MHISQFGIATLLSMVQNLLSTVQAPLPIPRDDPRHSYGSISPMNLAQFLSIVLTVQTFSSSSACLFFFRVFFATLSLAPSSPSIVSLPLDPRPLKYRSVQTSSLSTKSSSPQSPVASDSRFQPLTLLIHSVAAHTNLVESLTSCESDSTNRRSLCMDRMRSGAVTCRVVMKIEGDA